LSNHNAIRINVGLKAKPYEVVIGGSGLKGISKELIKAGIKEGSKILIVSNMDVAKPYGEDFQRNLNEYGFKTHFLILEAGEQYKNIETISQIHDAAYKANLERGSLMIALGGGVIGDMTGFAAATWLRGIDFVQVPTTLLAMVDAAIGGKTGVNHPRGKNLIGSFHQPKLVLIDPITLKTLPEREFRAGMAEVIKYGVIQDYLLFELLEKIEDLSNSSSLSESMLLNILERSALSKAKIVELDEHENGIRAILNYGHTFGHVIETLCGYGEWLHGEAVSMGMIAAGKLALMRNSWKQSDFDRQKVLLERTGLPIVWPKLNSSTVLETLQGDKKVRDETIRFIIPTQIGKVEICNSITKEEIKDCLYSL